MRTMPRVAYEAASLPTARRRSVASAHSLRVLLADGVSSRFLLSSSRRRPDGADRASTRRERERETYGDRLEKKE